MLRNMSKFIFPVLAMVLLGLGCSNERKPALIDEQPDRAVPIEQSTEKVIYNILNMVQKNGQFYATVASSTMFGGDEAVKQAVMETGCDVDRITDGSCAPSLNNNYYISKKFSPKLTFLLAQSVKISILQDLNMTQISAEHLFNLFTQTDAFAMGENRTPFIIDLEDGKINKIEQFYTP